MTAHTADQIIEAMARAMWHSTVKLFAWEELDEGAREAIRVQARAAYAKCLKLLRELK